MHPWILPLALHPGVHEVGVIAWVTDVPVDEINVVDDSKRHQAVFRVRHRVQEEFPKKIAQRAPEQSAIWSTATGVCVIPRR